MDATVVTAVAGFIGGLIVGTLVSWVLLRNFYQKRSDAVRETRP